MSQNIGTLISAAIRPNDSLDRIASAFASEIKGGFHTAATISDRDSIIVERRDWGMMCYVVDDKKTYQLTNGYSDSIITNNNNWKEFSGSGGSGGGDIEWLDSVKSVLLIPPVSPSNGDRYLVGRSPSDIVNWDIYTVPGFIAQWNSGLNRWDVTNPKDGTSLRVDDEDNAIYKYEGDWSTGEWVKEKLGQVRSFDVTTSNGLSFSATINPSINSYDRDMVFLAKFSSTNSGLTASLNINNIGDKLIKKASSTGLINLIPNEIDTSYVYSLTYDGVYFQMVKPYGDGIFDIKTYIEPSDYIVVPQYYQYLVYGDLTVSGYLENNGNVVIINGGLVLSGGTFSNNGNLVMTGISTGLTTSYNNTDTIEFTYQNTVFGPSVSATIIDGSITQSKLDIINPLSGTVGSLLTWTSSGQFMWIDSTSSGGSTPVYESKMSLSTSGDNQPTGFTLSYVPNKYSRIQIFINGQSQILGNGTSTSVDCYFWNGSSPILLDSLNIGDQLYWNGVYSGFDLTTNDLISVFYEK